MRAQEIIRSILDLIDGQKTAEPEIQVVAVAEPQEENPDTIRKFKQIVDLVSKDDTDGSASVFSNAPNEEYADIDAVTKDAGGGWQEPKHPSDIRVQHPSAYPGHQHNPENE